jgi:hypothetical protein
VAATSKQSAQLLFGTAGSGLGTAAIDVCSVDERDALLQGLVQDGPSRLVVQPAGEVVRAQANRRYL